MPLAALTALRGLRAACLRCPGEGSAFCFDFRIEKENDGFVHFVLLSDNATPGTQLVPDGRARARPLTTTTTTVHTTN